MSRRSPPKLCATLTTIGVLVITAFSTGARADGVPPAPPARPDPVDVLPPRPAEPPPRERAELPWERHAEIGPDLAYVSQPGTRDSLGNATGVSYGSSFGFALHASWPMWRYLQMSLYFFNSNHAVQTQPGALGLPGKLTSDSVQTYAFGARLQPMIPLGPRVRAWISGGVGWQRFNFPRMEVNEGGSTCSVNTSSTGCYTVYDRSNSMAQFPLGAGVAVEIVPRWLSIQAEFTAGIPAWQDGRAVEPLRVVDDHGHNRVVGGLPVIDLSLVETLGLSLIL